MQVSHPDEMASMILVVSNMSCLFYVLPHEILHSALAEDRFNHILDTSL